MTDLVLYRSEGMNVNGILGVAVIALAVLAGCGGSQDSNEGAPALATSATLAGKGFEEVSSDGLGLPGDHRSRILFSRKGIDFDAGCNHQSGSYGLNEGVFKTVGFSTTEVGCAKPLLRREKMVATFLVGSPTLTLDGDLLVISGSDGEMVLRESGLGRLGEDWLHGWDAQ